MKKLFTASSASVEFSETELEPREKYEKF